VVRGLLQAAGLRGTVVTEHLIHDLDASSVRQCIQNTHPFVDRYSYTGKALFSYYTDKPLLSYLTRIRPYYPILHG
jgi:hypothetical protein